MPDIAALDELLVAGRASLIADLRSRWRTHDPGVAGKWDRHCLALPRRSAGRRVTGVARFSDAGANVLAAIPRIGPSTAICREMRPPSGRCRKRRHRLHGPGASCRRRGDLSLTWAMTSHVLPWSRKPLRIAGRGFSPAASLRVGPGTGTAPARRQDPDPPVDTRRSCVGRERMFEYFLPHILTRRPLSG